MQRLVLRLPSLGREIHFYEGYWAPLTEGEVTLRDAQWTENVAKEYGLEFTLRPIGRPKKEEAIRLIA